MGVVLGAGLVSAAEDEQVARAAEVVIRIVRIPEETFELALANARADDVRAIARDLRLQQDAIERRLVGLDDVGRAHGALRRVEDAGLVVLDSEDARALEDEATPFDDLGDERREVRADVELRFVREDDRRARREGQGNAIGHRDGDARALGGFILLVERFEVFIALGKKVPW